MSAKRGWDHGKGLGQSGAEADGVNGKEFSLARQACEVKPMLRGGDGAERWTRHPSATV